VSAGALEFDAAEAAVAKDMAANTDLCLILALNVGSHHFEVFFEFCFSFRHCSRQKDDLVVVGWCTEN